MSSKSACSNRSPPTSSFALDAIDHEQARVREEKERETASEFLRLVNECRGKSDLIRMAATFFQEKSGCEAVGIRLKEGEDYPYYEFRGFSKEFIFLENRLCTCDEAGGMVRDEFGNPVLDCMCGNVLCGRFDPAKPFFTAQGSFWSNCTTELLASTTEADRQARSATAAMAKDMSRWPWLRCLRAKTDWGCSR